MRRAGAVGPFPFGGRGRLRPGRRAGGFRGRLRLQVSLRRAGPPRLDLRGAPPPGRRAARHRGVDGPCRADGFRRGLPRRARRETPPRRHAARVGQCAHGSGARPVGRDRAARRLRQARAPGRSADPRGGGNGARIRARARQPARSRAARRLRRLPPRQGRGAGRCAECRGRDRFAPEAGYPSFRPEPPLSSLPGHLATGRPPQRENRMKLVRSIALLLACTALPALAQDTRAIRVLVGFPPGGSTDVVTRILPDKLRESLGRPIVIENRPGNGGQVAAIQLKNAAPDGTTVMLTIDHTHVTIPLTFKEPGYDPLKDFTPIVGVAQYYNAMAASAKTGGRSLKDVAAWMKAHPSEHNFGIPAAGSIPQFAGLIVAQSLGVTMEPIP